MIKPLVALMLITCAVNVQAKGIEPINPISFEEKDANKALVIQFITSNVERLYCLNNTGMSCDSQFVLEKKREDLEAFKQLRNGYPVLVKEIITEHCRYDFSNCRYSEMLTDYKVMAESTKETLSW